MMETKWAAPVTYGASKFEVMTDEHHPRQIAVVNNLSDARLIAAAPELLAALEAAEARLAGLQMFHSGELALAIYTDMLNARAAIAKATGA